MLDCASLSAFYLCFALLYAAEPKRAALARAHVRLPMLSGLAYRLLAWSVFVLGVWLSARAHGGATALLVALTALTTIASVFVLLAPLLPRATWLLTACCPFLIFVFSTLGVLHG